MAERSPFRPDTATPAQLDGAQTDFILPICLPDPELMVGDALAVPVVTTVEEKGVRAPIGVKALEHLRGIVAGGMGALQTDNEA